MVSIACGADTTLAQDSVGTTWGWGSNFYSQLGRIPPHPPPSSSGGKGGGGGEGQPGKVFTLRTSKRLLKVPHSIQSNVERPRVLCGLPCVRHMGLVGGAGEETAPDSSSSKVGLCCCCDAFVTRVCDTCLTLL